jgi:hypothetical protein
MNMAVLPAGQDDNPVTDQDIQPAGSTRAALRVWGLLLALLAAVGLFGWIVMTLTRSLR